MKIISKKKDYYDYLIGIYGIDEKRVLTRENSLCGPIFPWKDTYYSEHDRVGDLCFLHVADKRYPLLLLADRTIVYGYEEIIAERYKNFESNRNWKIKNDEIKGILELYKVQDSDLNDLHGSPVIVQYDFKLSRRAEVTVGINLEAFEFFRVMSAHDVYVAIFDWLGKEKDIIDNRSDDLKIEGAGFDTKRSFRPQMKEKRS